MADTLTEGCMQRGSFTAQGEGGEKKDGAGAEGSGQWAGYCAEAREG